MQETPVLRRRRHGGTMPALLVIAIGVIFLFGNLGFDLVLPYNWWAWLILVAAIVPLFRGIQSYNAAGRLDGAATQELLNAGIIVMIALIFLLHLSWQTWWPVFVIYAGLCMLVRYRER